MLVSIIKPFLTSVSSDAAQFQTCYRVLSQRSHSVLDAFTSVSDRCTAFETILWCSNTEGGDDRAEDDTSDCTHKRSVHLDDVPSATMLGADFRSTTVSCRPLPRRVRSVIDDREWMRLT